MFLIIIIILGVLGYWSYWRWSNRRLLDLAAKLPGPPALPILGNALLFVTEPEEQLNKISSIIDTYGPYCRVWLGPNLLVGVKDPADIRLLLTSNKVNEKGPFYEFMKPLIGPGILSGGPTWRNHRKIATPSYNKRSTEIFAPIFNREAEDLANVLSFKGDVTFDVYFDVLRCTTFSVCQTLMGLTKEETLNLKRLNEVVLKTQRMYTHIYMKMTRWWLQIPIIYWLTGQKSVEDYYIKIINELAAEIISKRKVALSKVKDVNEDGMGIVDRYILSGELTEQELKWETFSLFTTSQEAAAKIASGVLLILAHLPDWQEKVYNEIVEVIGEDDVTEKDLKRLLYLDMVYKETLRYFPIAAFIQRTVEEDVAINEGKITLPVGTSVIIPIHPLHRDPEFWEEPHKMKPERFLPENVKKRDPNVFIPFSLGAMDCMGRVYATALIKTIVVKVLREVRLEVEGSLDNLELHIAISVKSAKGYNIRACPRRSCDGSAA